MKKYTLSVLIYLFVLALITSCGGGGGGGGFVAFQDNAALHNGGTTGIYGKGNQTGNGMGGGTISSLSAEAGTFTPCNDIEWSKITLTITITSDGETTTHTFDSGDKDAIAEVLTSLKSGDVLTVSTEIEMQDGSENRTSSAGPVTIGVGDNHISIPTPYSFTCATELCKNAYEDYGCTDYPSVTLTSGEYSGFYTVNDAASKLPSADDIEAPGYKFDHWETIDGQPYTPGVTKGDVTIVPVMKPDYTCAYGDLPTDIVIASQQDFNDLISTHGNQDFSGKTITLFCNVSTSTGFTNTTDGFQGTFNGNNKTVNVNLTNNDENGLGFCYKLASGATIQNLTITGSLVYSGSDSISTDSVANAGAFAAYNQGSIEHCKNMANVTTTNSDCNYVGGIVGFGDGAGSLTGCSNYGTINNAGSYAGGIIGCISGNFSIYQCFNKGSVTAHKSSGLEQHVGGIVGTDSSAGRIEHCYNTGNVIITANSNSDAGGIVGLTNDGTISSCFNYGTANIQTSFGGGSCKQIASAVYGTTITDVYCTVPTNAGSSLTSGTMTDAINMLPVTEPLIWELRSGASYPTLINNPE